MRALVSVAVLLLASPELILGVLEEGQDCDPDAKRTVEVRPLFSRSGGEWTSLSEEEVLPLDGLSWTIGLDGRSLGAVRTLDGGLAERTLRVAPGERVPEIRNVGESFEGWCSTPTRRPLVVSSRSDVRDPDRWKPFRASQSLCDRLFHEFRAEAGDASCGDGRGNVVEVPYHAEDLRVASAYRDRAGRLLVAVVLPFEERCDGPWEGPWKARWFLLTGDRSRYVGSNLELVDFGDYDEDGSSEILFWYRAYDEDGYTLLHDGLEKRTDHHWNYAEP
jgi:hypothetical protein